MADDRPFPLYGSTFDSQGEQPPERSFPLYGSTFDKETIRDPTTAAVGTGLSGVPAQSGTWGDVVSQAVASTHGVLASGAGAMAAISGDRKTEEGWRQTARGQQEAEQENLADITPTVQPGWRHPFMWAAEQGPGIAALAIPAAASNLIAPGVGPAIVLGAGMSAQTLGGGYNRLTDEGIEPTTQQKIGLAALGAAQGLAMEATGGLFKLPVSPLISTGLGITGEATTFGLGAAGEEYAAQQAEIAAGHRDRLDSGAIGSQFVGGAETGVGFGVTHLIRRGEAKPPDKKPEDQATEASALQGTGRDLTQTPGESSIARTPPDKRATEVKKPVSVVATDPDAKGPAAPSSPVGDAEEQALQNKPASTPANSAPSAPTTPTPGVEQQTASVEPPPEVVQPTPPPAGTATEAPPAAATTGPPSTQPPAPEVAPAPAPAPAAAPPVPESDATLREQQGALLDPTNAREAMVYPQGTKPFDITQDKWRYGTTKLGDGRWVQYDTRGPNRLTKAKIAELDKNNKLNDLLQLGPVPQTEAVQRSVAGVEEPAVVTERAPPTVPGEPGVERKAAEGTTATAPAQVAALEATKTPGSTVQVETHAETVGDRLKKTQAEAATPRVTLDEQLKAREAEKVAQAKATEQAFATERAARVEALKREMNERLARGEPVAGEKSEAEKIREAAQATAPPSGGRVLRSETKEEAEAAERMRLADAAAAERVAAEQAAPPKVKPIKPPDEVKPGKKSGKEIERMKAINAIADDVVRNHPMLSDDEKLNAIDPNRPGGKGARLNALKYVKDLLDKAEKAGFEFKDRFMHRTKEELQHSNAASVLYEAKLLRDAKEKDFGRFFHHEFELRTKGREAYHALLKDRFETGKERAKQLGRPTGEAQAVEDVEKAAAPTTREGVKAGDVDRPDVAEEYEAAKERVAEEEVAKAPGEERKETPLQKQAREASERARARLAEEEKRSKERPTRESRGEEETGDVRGFKQATGFKVEKTRPKWKKQEGESDEDRFFRWAVEQEDKFRKDYGKTPRDSLVTKINEAFKQGDGKRIRELMDEFGWKKQENWVDKFEQARQAGWPEEDEGDKPAPVTLTAHDGSKVTINPSRTSDAETAIKESYGVRHYAKGAPQIMGKLRDMIVKLAGDTPVHYVTDEEMQKITGSAHGAFTQEHGGVILLNSEYPSLDTPMHEALHAALWRGLKKYPEFRDKMERLRLEVIINMPKLKDPLDFEKIEYYLSDHEEFLVGMMTNPKMQELLKGVKISKTLAKELGIPQWRKMTMWEGALSIIRDALGLGPRDTSAIEATMALTEEAMWQHPRGVGDLIEASGRLANKQMGAGWKLQQRIPEQQVETKAKDAQEATRKPHEFWKSEFARAKASGTAEKAYKLYTKVSNSDTLRIASEHLFGRRDENNSFRRVQEGMERMGQAMRNYLSEHDGLIQRVADMKRLNPTALHEVVSLLAESKDFNVHPDEGMGVGRNSHINPKQFDETAGAEHQESFLAHPRLAFAYENMKPDQQSLFRELRDTLMEEGKKNAVAHYKKFSDMLRTNFEQDDKLQAALAKPENDRSPAELKQVERYNAITKVLDGEKLEGDEKEKFNNDPQIENLRNLKSLQKQEGPFYPGTRKGGMLVNAEHEIPEAPNALSVKDNEVTFATRKEAFDYRQKLVDKSLPSNMEIVHEPVSSEQGRGEGEDTYKVTVINKHSSGVENKYEGGKLAESLRQQGLKNVTEPMVREKNEHVDYGLHSGTVRAMGHAVDALTHLSKEQKEDLKGAVEQASLGLMRGNRANLGLLRSNRVRGANADPVLALHDYFSASASNRARVRFMPDIDKALGEMRDTARKDQNDDTWKRGLLIGEMENRILNSGREGFTGQMPPALQYMSTLAYLKYMMAPVHYALDLTHPYLISIPQLAGRHGFLKTQVAFQKALNDMGGRTPALTKGLMGAWKSAWETGRPPTDFVAGIIRTLKKNGATADEMRAIEQALETGHLHSILMDFRPHMDKTGAGQFALQRAQGIGQEMSSAVDAINRIATYLSAYRLERGKIGEAKTPESNAAHHAQAIRYAKDSLSQTQGLYTSTNRASMMKNPAVRAAMQFRSVPMMIYKIMARNIYDIARPETPEVRWAAVRSLVGTMGSTMVLAGAPAGIPEPIRLAVMLTHMLGLSGSWQDLEDKARKEAESSLGKVGGHMVMDGVLGAAGLGGAGSRIGLNDLLVKGDPTASGVKQVLFDTLIGAGGGYVNDEVSGVGKIMGGDFAHGIPQAIPIRLFSDVSKAYFENQEGKPARGASPSMAPLDPFETFVRAMGGTPEREALYNKMTGMIIEDKAAKRDAIKAAAGGDRTAMGKWNAAHPKNLITHAHVFQARQENKIDTPRQRATREEYSAYQ